MPLPFSFDYKNPDYNMVFEWRLERINEIRKNPKSLPALKKYYQENIAQFIIDWGCTSDPRHVEIGLPTVIPLLLFPRQEEFVYWIIEKWKCREFGIAPKSREIGFTCTGAAVSAALCILFDGISLGWGSRKELYVDKRGEPKTIFHKIREFTSLLPPELRAGWVRDNKSCDKLMLLTYPETGSTISGEAGDNIGRGARTSIYFVDESAFIERPEMVDAALSQTTNCRIDISTPQGPNNPFARKYRNYEERNKFIMRWQDDPRKDQIWYENQKKKLDDDVIVAQELDLDFNASVEGVLIPNDWIIASIDSHEKLGINVSGIRKVGFDVADKGRDKNALCGRYGIMIESLKEFSGKGSTIFKTVKEQVFTFCDEQDYHVIRYDADGLGAGVRGDAEEINKQRKEKGVHEIEVTEFTGSGSVVNPEEYPFNSSNTTLRNKDRRTNDNFFENLKAQGWFDLKKRFERTYKALNEKDYEYNEADLISISSKIPTNLREKLINELSQPTVVESKKGKQMIDKVPDEMPSPNLADAVMIAFSPQKRQHGGFFGAKN